MSNVTPWTSSRRQFFIATAAGLAGAGWAKLARADEKAPSPLPRATSGDAVEPAWDQRLSITVGPAKADLVGSDDKVLQAAVDYVARLGGGTVKVLPGAYRLRNAVYLASRVRLLGSGEDSILVKEPSTVTELAADSDWFDQEVTLADPAGFRLGDGVCVRAKNPHNGGENVCKRTLVARSGNRFKLDRALRENFWQTGKASIATLFPIISGENISEIAIENIVLDGNKAQNEHFDGNYAGCIFLQDCQRVALGDVTARNYNGDGLSWQVCHDVTVENCRSQDNADLGLHAGSGSQRTTIRNNRVLRNDIGVFLCWGVKSALVEANEIDDSRSHGVSIGHRDTDNVVRDNDIRRSGKTGVLFRPERGRAFAPHRNRLEGNRIIDSGPADGVAVDVQGETEAIVIEGNTIRETRQPLSRVGIRIGAQAGDVKLADNQIEGFATDVANLRQP